MARRFAELSDRHIGFIARQRVFFVATATADSRINLSPKGMDTLRVAGPKRVRWLNLTGSGNETVAHVRESSRMTLMFCSFDADPLILRVYGQARSIHPGDAEWPGRIAEFPSLPGARQVFDLAVDLVQTSCGFAVPFYEFQGERRQLRDWAEKKGEAGIRRYWRERNRETIDGRPIDPDD